METVPWLIWVPSGRQGTDESAEAPDATNLAQTPKGSDPRSFGQVTMYDDYV
jgi:hypothetical protein